MTNRVCFIVGPGNAELGSLRAALERRNIAHVRTDPELLAAQSIAPVLTQMKKADFVCVILHGTPTANVMLEAGIAIGLRKPILIIAASSRTLPFDLTSVSVVRLENWDSKVVELHLDAFLTTLPARRRSARASTQPPDYPKKETFEWVENALESMSSAAYPFDAASALQFEQLILELFRRTGYSVTTSPVRDYGADIAVWSPKIKHDLGSPILVQVKLASISPSQADAESQRLSQLIQAGRGSAGLLVSLRQAPLSQRVLARRPAILAVTAQELISLLGNDRLLDSVIAARDMLPGPEQ